MRNKDTVIDRQMEIDRLEHELARLRPVEPSSEPAEEEAPPQEPDPFAEPEPRRPSKLAKYMGSLLSGNILSLDEVRRHYPYMLFVAFLLLLYISNVFRMQQLHRRHELLTKEVGELRAQSMTVASKRMNATRQSRIVEEVERRGLNLNESLSPPKIIEE